MIYDKTFPFYLAQFRKIAVANLTLGMMWSEAYLTALTKMLWPDEKPTSKF